LFSRGKKRAKTGFEKTKITGQGHGLFLIFRFWRSSSRRKTIVSTAWILAETTFLPSGRKRADWKPKQAKSLTRRSGGGERGGKAPGSRFPEPDAVPAGKRTLARFQNVENRHGAGEKIPEPEHPVMCQVKN
jgi:hypothetical protein